jgi:hypothetical protein
MEQRAVTAFAQLHQQTTDVPIADLQPLGSFDLRDVLLPYLVQHT